MKENRRFRTFPQLDPFHVRCLTKDRVHLLACAPSGWTLWDLHTGVPAELGLSSCFVAEEHDHPRAQIFRHENVLELRQDSLRQPRMLHVAAAAAVPYGFEVARLSPDMRWIFIRSTKGVSLWDTAADQFLWKIPEWVEDEFLKFSPDSRLALCADQLELKILESQTGEPVGKISLRDTADMGMIHFHLAGDKVICHARVSDADSSPGHLAAWWPFGSKTKGPGVQALMVVAEFPGARELLRVRRDDIHPIPDSDGRSVVAVTQKGDQYFIEAWDLPARRPWEWIVGVPVALALAGTLFNRWRKRRRLVRT